MSVQFRPPAPNEIKGLDGTHWPKSHFIISDYCHSLPTLHKKGGCFHTRPVPWLTLCVFVMTPLPSTRGVLHHGKVGGMFYLGNLLKSYFWEMLLCSSFLSVVCRSDQGKNENFRLLTLPTNIHFPISAPIKDNHLKDSMPERGDK